ncbi:ABC transporter ATP-binding protein/permease [Psychrosphaera sp. B3R10]|uniref:ABCB family ABC transporter ATP-binding protein/permease n=1 Tax=unclassified Psychrosphaera TaxID=2641570 RepID=UPI001C0A19A4|nr:MULTISPECIES: ABC transporter ATP-binding protein/permease [unclassified Psychrosphaera]MBU2883101.1 ABC transporter ATP-binding protein/permease [Psychrosphaera sp. I2R16]MBU2988557.1 ABC transporter ATP-binding protein/permease [Psychrosphaera sp. B3R10]MDO6719619.1 ABC transporter ATP-binding protein/permease [Psychrosphaera sp. 1_MG-2023]
MPDDPVDFNWRSLTALIPYILEHKVRVFLALGCLVLAKVASVGLPFILKHVVDDLDKMNDGLVAIVSVPLALVIAYGAVRFSTVLLGEIRDTLFGRVTERAMRRVGLKLFNHLHELDLDFHLNRQTGGLSRDMERGTTGISFLMRFMVFNIVPILLEIMFVVIIFFTNYGIEFAAITLLSIVAYVAYTAVATEWRTKYVREANKADSSSNSRAIDSLLNYETVKYFNNEDYEASRYDEDLAKWETARRKNRLTLFALNSGQALVVAISMTAMLVLAAEGVVAKEMTLGDFVLINAFMMQLFMPLNFLGFVYREIKGSLANIENMFALLRKQPKVQDSIAATELVVTTAKIEFKDVKFHYNKKRQILDGINFTILPGQKVAVVGESGAGKSTLAKLLFRFYDVSSGQILIDEQPIDGVSQHSLRKNIGVVPQDTVLFNDTIFENIKYGDPQASEEDVWRAIELAHLKSFIVSLPDQEKTMVGERGLKLSGGEKQRVAIARTILKRPPILVFDEATSSLDSGSEQAILTALKSIAKGHSSLVVAHRLSTIVDSDNILVMVKGKIVEQGTHHELLNLGGHYATMWAIQNEQRSETE